MTVFFDGSGMNGLNLRLREEKPQLPPANRPDNVASSPLSGAKRATSNDLDGVIYAMPLANWRRNPAGVVRKSAAD
ncbi:MAG: hypothetical protein HC774_04155 [Sphingomonadales bacterium]|nr:hypothetical protein [Sphingomonadales bacterium]